MKTKQILLGITFIFSMMIGNLVVAQNNFDATNLTTKWSLIKEENGLKFYVQKLECSQFANQKDFVYSVLKIENTTNEAVNLTYNYSLIYDEMCSGCDIDGEFRYTVTIPANESIEGNCDNLGNGLDRLIDNPNLKPGWTLKGIDVLNINIK